MLIAATSFFSSSTLRRIAQVGLLAGAGLSGAWAQNASNGALLYTQAIVSGKSSCSASACHGASPASGVNKISRGVSAPTLRSSLSSVGEMRFLSGHLTDSQINDLSAYIAQVTGKTPTYLSVSASPSVSLSATSLAFGAVVVGLSSSRSLSLSNSGNAALNISSLTVDTGASHFSLSHDCPDALPVGSACTLNVSYAPASTGSHSGRISLVSNASGSPHRIGLSGSGVAAATALLDWSDSATSYTLPSTAVGATSASQTLTLLNGGSATAQLTQVALSGSDAADFVLGGSCVSSLAVAAGGSCSVTLALSPSSVGGKTATLNVSSSNATNPAAIVLSGTATAADSGSGSADNGNVGGGGCTIGPADAPADPLWWLLTGLAAGVLAWRSRRPRR